jgi:hypothetical protein
MLTFTKVTREAFERAQVSAIDLSKAFGTDLQSAALQLGKALNDPTEGLSALTRSGVSFSEGKKADQANVEAGDAAGAQAMILDELNRQFGGQGAAFAASYAGSWSDETGIWRSGQAIGELFCRRWWR